MKKKRTGTCVAQSQGARDSRDRNHKLSVARLQRSIWNYLDDPDESTETELFAPRAVADAIGGSIKVIRSLSRRRLLQATKRGRRLFFRADAVRKYVRRCGATNSPGPYDACFRSEKIATDERFVSGHLIPKAQAANGVKLSIRGVDRAITAGQLGAVKIGKMTFVELNSFLEFSSKRDREAFHACVLAREKLEAAKKNSFEADLAEAVVTKEGAARELAISKDEVEHLIKSGVLKAFGSGKRTYIFREDMHKPRP